MSDEGVLHQTCQECGGKINKPVAKFKGCAVKKDCSCKCGLRTVADENHEPRVGFSCNVIVYDPINHKKYLYDSNGIYTDISGSTGDVNELHGYDYISKVKDYLFKVKYNTINYEYAYDYFKSKMPIDFIVTPACTSVYRSGILGRNLDWTYDENVSFIVETPRDGFRYASIGVAGSLQLTQQFVESGEKSELYELVPFYMQDGVNENGLMVSTNVVPREHGDNKYVQPTGTVEAKVCSVMLPRFILDNFKTAQEAVGYIQSHVATFTPQQLISMGYEQHFIVADENDSFVLEFNNGAYNVKAGNIITNFYVNDVNFNSDGTVNTPETAEQGHYATQNNITMHGQGLERYNVVVNGYGNLDSVADFESMLRNLYYTKSYSTSESVSNPFWYTEAVGGELTVNSLPIDFADRKEAMGYAYEHRTRNGETWQTVHSVVYDPFARKMYLAVQEENTYEEHALTFDYTNDDIDNMLAEKQDILTAGDGIIINGDVIEADTNYLATLQHVDDEVSRIDGNIGDLSELETTAKDNLVEAINEAYQEGGAVRSVNGETGEVELTASDIMAADSHTVQENLGRIDDEIDDIHDSVVQTTGDSTTNVMSQKAVTDIIGDVETLLQTLISGGGAQ